MLGYQSQSTYVCRVQSSVWRLPKYWPPYPPCECVLPPHQRRGVHTRREVRGWGSIFWKTPDIGLASYSTYNPSTLSMEKSYVDRCDWKICPSYAINFKNHYVSCSRICLSCLILSHQQQIFFRHSPFVYVLANVNLFCKGNTKI
jgi:hypothetical protein